MNEEPVQRQSQETSSFRYAEIGLVLLVAFTPYFIAAITAYLQPPQSVDVTQLPARLLIAIAHNLSALLVMRYVLFRQGKGWRSIGLGFEGGDILNAFGLLVLAWIGTFGAAMMIGPIGNLLHLHPQFVDARKLLWGSHVSTMVVLYLTLNPFFEEFIVRGFLMSQLMEMGRRPFAVFLVSVAIQSAYHIYQGWTNMIVLSAAFMVYSAYFLATKKLAPIVLAHLGMDLLALLPRH